MTALLIGAAWMPGLASAQTADQTTIQQLQQQIVILTNLVNELRAMVQAQQNGQVGVGLRLSDPLLAPGRDSADVTTLQQILATDPTIYPEGFVTGHYGPLTQAAVARFQQKYGISPEDGVGPVTMAKLNMILQNGAGNSGMVPPGLLLTIGPGYQLPPGLSNGGVTVSNIGVTGVSPNSAQVNLTTSGPSTSVVWYSTSPITSSNMGQPAGGASNVSGSQTITLTGLVPNTTYYYQVVSTDPSGRVTTSPQQVFFTGTSGSTGAGVTFSNIVPTNITGNSAQINWSTSGTSNSVVWYSTSPISNASMGQSLSASSNMSGGQSLTLTGLQPNTTYYYVVRATDPFGNVTTSSQQTFTTGSGTTSGNPGTGPVITGVSPSSVGPNVASILWNTSTNADSKVLFSTSPIGPDTETAGMVMSADFTGSHNLQLTGLSSNTSYYYVVVSKDIFGNTSTSTQQVFSTTAQ